MTIWCVLCSCWMSMATNYSYNMQYVLLFNGNNGYANAPQCYVIHTLHVLYILLFLTTLSFAELYSFRWKRVNGYGVFLVVFGVKPVPVYLVHHKSHMDVPGIEPRPRSERPATNRLSHSTTHCMSLKTILETPIMILSDIILQLLAYLLNGQVSKNVADRKYVSVLILTSESSACRNNIVDWTVRTVSGEVAVEFRICHEACFCITL